MTPDDPRHGSYAGAMQHWKDKEPACDPCRIEARRSRKRRHVATQRGMPARVPLGERAHRIIVTSPRVQLSEATGILKPRLLLFETAGPEKVVHRNTRDRILAFERRWTNIGIQRRLQALGVAGWSARAFAAHAGIDAGAVNRMRARTNIVFVREAFGDAIATAYETLSDTPAPPGASATETTCHALAQRWAPAHAWLDIDDPDEVPDPGYQTSRGADEFDPVVVDRIVGGDWRLAGSTAAEKRAVVARWQGELSDNQIEARTGWNVARDIRPHVPRKETAA